MFLCLSFQVESSLGTTPMKSILLMTLKDDNRNYLIKELDKKVFI